MEKQQINKKSPVNVSYKFHPEYVDDEKKCSRCNKYKKLKEFLDGKGKETKLCADCLKYKRARMKFLREREKDPVNVSYKFLEKTGDL